MESPFVQPLERVQRDKQFKSGWLLVVLALLGLLLNLLAGMRFN